MKKLFIALFVVCAFNAQAQKNALLDQAFWKNKPDAAAVQAEIAKGANPAETTSNMFDPAVYAINAGAPAESIKLLLDQKGNDVNKITHDSRTYIFWAAMRGNTEVMEYLISKGAKVDIMDSHGATPLTFAAGGGQPDTKVYDILVKGGVNVKKDVNGDGANALMLSVAADKDFALMNYFVSKGLDLNAVDANGNTAFAYATRTGNIELLKSLVKKGVKYNDNAMLFAAQGGGRGGATGATLATFEYLESLNLKPTVVGKNGENVLHAIARRPKATELIAHFIAKGVDVNKADNDGNTPFMLAAASNTDPATIELLAGSVKNINLANKKGLTALTMAVRSNSPEAVSMLIAKGADVKTIDAAGDNLGYYVIQSYSPQRVEAFEAKVKILQDKGLDMAAPQKNGNTVYHLAVAKDDMALIKRVASFNADINGKNKEGMTALHKAALIAHDDTVLKYLIASGAKKDVLTDLKESPFDLASENEYLTKKNVSVTFLK